MTMCRTQLSSKDGHVPAKVGAFSASVRSAFRDLAVDNAHGIIPPCQLVNGTCSIKGGSSFRFVCKRDGDIVVKDIATSNLRSVTSL